MHTPLLAHTHNPCGSSQLCYQRCMPRFDTTLWLIGPEMSKAGHEKQVQLTEKLEARCYRGTTSDFLHEHMVAEEGPAGPAGAGSKAAAKGLVLVVAFNTGMAR